MTFLTITASAQFGNYQSLHMPFGARNAALGGRVVSLADGDLMQFAHNPAVLDSVEIADVAVNFSPLFSGIYSFSGAFAANVGGLGKMAFGLTYLDYGDFTETLANGDEIGDFTVNDLVIMAGKSHRIASFTIGANVKYATNAIAGFGSSLFLADFGGIYRAPNADFTAGLVFKNFGFVLSDYAEAGTNEVPFDVQISTSIKPQYMPFRFSLSAFNLAENDLYFQPEGAISRSRTVEVADKIFRRINIGTEFILHESIQLLFGYSHLMRQELKIGQEAYGAGLSYGLAIGIRQFKLRYTHATYHAAGGTDFFTIQTNINSFKKIL